MALVRFRYCALQRYCRGDAGQWLYRCWLTVQGTLADVETELSDVRQTVRIMGGAEPNEIETPSGSDIWAAALRNTRGMLQVRVGVPAKDLPVYINDQAVLLHTGTFRPI